MEYGIKSKDLTREYAEDYLANERDEKNDAFIDNMNAMMQMIADSLGNSSVGVHQEIESVNIRNSNTGMHLSVKTKRSVFVAKR